MSHYFAAVLTALAAALAFVLALPAGADSADWELPSYSSQPH